MTMATTTTCLLAASLVNFSFASPPDGGTSPQERVSNPNTGSQAGSGGTAPKPYQDLVGAYLAKFKPIYKGPISGLAKKTIIGPNKERLLVGDVTKNLFALQRDLEQQLRKAPSGALFGGVTVVELGIELPDAYILTRAIRFYVADADKLRAASPVFADAVPKPNGKMTLKDLTPEMRAGFFQAKDALLGTTTDSPVSASGPSSPTTLEPPLRRAAQLSDQALLDATITGIGEQTVTDTFVFLKNQPTITLQGQIMIPAFRDGVVDISQREPMAQTFAQPLPGPLPLPTTISSGGLIDQTAQLMQGFTYPNHWHWKRRWEFWTGHAELEAQLSYGFGVRAPVELRLRLAPSVVSTTGTHDSSSRIDGLISAHTLDGDANFYNRAGMVSSTIFDGKEFVLFASFCYGYSFEALWIDLGTRACDPYGFDFSRDFKPPMGESWERLMEVFIPPEWTHTVIDVGFARGTLEVGAALEAKGSLAARLRAYVDDAALALRAANTVLTNEHVVRLSTPDAPQTFTAMLPIRSSPGTSVFGLIADSFVYHAEMSLLPGLRYGVRIGYGSFSRSFSDTFWVDAWRIHLPSIELDTHEPTRSQVKLQGSKTYKRSIVGD
jgi:hypothetical protein